MGGGDPAATTVRAGDLGGSRRRNSAVRFLVATLSTLLLTQYRTMGIVRWMIMVDPPGEVVSLTIGMRRNDLRQRYQYLRDVLAIWADSHGIAHLFN